jgi:hypothetical protein
MVCLHGLLVVGDFGVCESRKSVYYVVLYANVFNSNIQQCERQIFLPSYPQLALTRPVSTT